MSGAENYEERALRIVRHKFEPSEYLEEQLSELVDFDKMGNRRIEIFGTRQIGLSLQAYNASRYHTKLTDIEERFRNHNMPQLRPIHLAGEPKVQRLNDGRMMRLMFAPAMQHSFNMLLNDLKVEMPPEPKLYAEVPSIEAATPVDQDLLHQKPQKRYLYVDIATRALIPTSQEDWQATLMLFDTTNPLTFVTPLEISGYDYRYRVKRDDLDHGPADFPKAG